MFIPMQAVHLFAFQAVKPYQAEIFTKYPVFLCDNLKEIWLSDKVDAVQFLQHLKSATEGNGTGLEKWYWTNSTSFGTADATLYISSAAAVCYISGSKLKPVRD